jgi:hypothetical protein
MPPAAALAIPAIAGVGAQAAGGKKGNNAAKDAANKQFALQQQVLQFGQGLANQGMSAWTPASNYWQALLSGDPNKTAQAVGPTSDAIRQQSAASSAQLAATSPMGGEANAAQAANAAQTSNNMARLYAGVQPTAANALGQLSGIPLGAGISARGQGAPNVGSGLKFNTHAADQQNQQKGSLGQGVGTLIGRGMSGGKGSAGKSGSSSPAGNDPSGASSFPGA